MVLPSIPQNRSGWMFSGVSAQDNIECQNGQSPSILIEHDGKA